MADLYDLAVSFPGVEDLSDKDYDEGMTKLVKQLRNLKEDKILIRGEDSKGNEDTILLDVSAFMYPHDSKSIHLTSALTVDRPQQYCAIRHCSRSCYQAAGSSSQK
jgi:hypothetical protein